MGGGQEAIRAGNLALKSGLQPTACQQDLPYMLYYAKISDGCIGIEQKYYPSHVQL